MTAAVAEVATVSSGNAADVAGAEDAVPVAVFVLAKLLEALLVAVAESAVATLAVGLPPSADGIAAAPTTRPAWSLLRTHSRSLLPPAVECTERILPGESASSSLADAQYDER